MVGRIRTTNCLFGQMSQLPTWEEISQPTLFSYTTFPHNFIHFPQFPPTSSPEWVSERGPYIFPLRVAQKNQTSLLQCVFCSGESSGRVGQWDFGFQTLFAPARAVGFEGCSRGDDGRGRCIFGLIAWSFWPVRDPLRRRTELDVVADKMGVQQGQPRLGEMETSKVWKLGKMDEIGRKRGVRKQCWLTYFLPGWQLTHLAK
ncbi:Uncharacterized protein Adt_02673 [Abeliophyllum distichum]|uniref:Uncharacterized protein n=1 Tax=Abeliophyllum distichum TaxID=126358 RepID=A0ABD1VWB0_9LAMI